MAFGPHSHLAELSNLTRAQKIQMEIASCNLIELIEAAFLDLLL